MESTSEIPSAQKLTPFEDSKETLAHVKKALAARSEKIADAAGWMRESEFEFRPVNLVEGDVHISGNLDLAPEIYVVTGDLVVDGTLRDCLEYSLLIVGGSLRAKNIVSTCMMHVGGDVEVQGVLYGESSCDYFADIHGTLRAAAVIEDGTSIEAGKIESPLVYSSNSVKAGDEELPRSPDEAARTMLVDDVLEKDGVISQERMIDALMEGRSVLRSASP